MSGWQIKKLLKQLAKILNICDIVFCGNLMVNLVVILEIYGSFLCTNIICKINVYMRNLIVFAYKMIKNGHDLFLVIQNTFFQIYHECLKETYIFIFWILGKLGKFKKKFRILNINKKNKNVELGPETLFWPLYLLIDSPNLGLCRSQIIFY